MAKNRTAASKDVTDRKKIRQSITVRDNNDYITIKQTEEFNKMQQIGIKCGELNVLTGNYEMAQGDYLYQIIDYDEKTRKLRTSTKQLCLAIVYELYEKNFETEEIILNIRDYMNMRGLSDLKAAREQMLYDINVLYNLEGVHDGRRFRILQDTGLDIRKHGTIPVTVGNKFFKLLKESPYCMSIPKQLFKLSAKKNPNSYCFLYKLTSMKRVNLGKKRENVISMDVLLKSAPDLPSYEEVMKDDRAITKHIIRPVIRDLDVLDETLKWSVYDKSGELVEKSDLLKMPYNDFIKLSVLIDWVNYPAAKKYEIIESKQSKKANKGKTDKIIEIVA